MIDLRKALECIETMKKYGGYNGERVGIVMRECSGMVTSYAVGDVVLFREEKNEKKYFEHTPIRDDLTIETPYGREEIERNRSKGSLITTFKTMVCVPRNCIEEIVF